MKRYAVLLLLISITVNFSPSAFAPHTAGKILQLDVCSQKYKDASSGSSIGAAIISSLPLFTFVLLSGSV